MDKKLKTKWVKALRSGKYKQAEAALYKDRAHCCLGVLARVQGAVVRAGSLKLNGENVSKGHYEFLAPQFSAGLHTKTQQRLGAMNDGTGTFRGKRKNFDQIADFIEKNL